MDKVRKISCVILDDQLFATKILSAYIEKMPQLELLLSTTDAGLALSTVENNEVDLVFLDIQMPKMNGLDFLKHCKNRARFIFTTAYSDYAIDGYENDVVDFLLKPIAFERFQRAIDKYKALVNSAHVATGQTNSKIVVKGDAKQKYHQLDVADIAFVKGLNNYIAIHRVLAAPIITYRNLKDMVNELPENDFCQVHRSYIVSLAHIRSIEKDSIQIGEETIPISASYKTHFFVKWQSRR